MEQKAISKAALMRLPLYLSYLKSIDPKTNISSAVIASALGMGDVQVRKDLALVYAGGGKPKVGYSVEALIEKLERFLGYDDVNDAVLVGAGKLGRALLSFKGFENYGLNIVAAFDDNESIVGETDDGKTIFHISKFKDLCSRMKVRIGIITVPEEYAADVCNLMIESGILAIWNFSPVHLEVPDNILVQNENMAASLAMLSRHLDKQISNC